ncbi:MAG TPA: hypothetical protein VG942_06360, partial [Hyphomonadaceae bacterium]|nr:hypothetical protein [Hyphomonadaceae bacterium]
MSAIVAVVMLPLVILNFLGGIAGAVWLAILGRWDLVGAGIAYAIAGPLLLSLPLMLGMAFALPAMKAVEHNNIVAGILLAVISCVWNAAIMTASAVTVFVYIMKDYDPSHPIWPYLLLAYGTAMGPWAFLARKDAQSGNENSSTMVALFQFSVLAMAVKTFLDQHADPISLAIWGAPALLLGVLLQTGVL